MAYSKQFNGYVADVPHMWFKRNDGKIFYFDELTQATITPQINYTEINAGWSLYPVAYLPGQSSFEMQITSGKFEADMFSMTNGTDFEENDDYEFYVTEHLTGTSSDKNTVYTLSHDATGCETSVSIRGMTYVTGTTITNGQFSVASSSGKTTVTVLAADIAADETVEISYCYKKTVMEAQIDNRSSAVGEAVLLYPVYGAGDEIDATNKAKFGTGSITGYVIVKVYKARVTAQPGLDGSYKSASTFQFTLATLDPKRDDSKVYSIAYVEGALTDA